MHRASLLRVRTGLRSLAAVRDAPVQAWLRAERRDTGRDRDFTVDDNETAGIDWTDRDGDVTTAPDGVTVSLTSSDTTIVDNPVVGSPLVVHKSGEVDVTASAVNADGTATSFPDQTAHLSISPGAATGFAVSINGAPPVPVSGP